MPWSRLIALQKLQDTDLLYRVLDRQQQLANQRFGNEDSTQTDSVQSSADLQTDSARSNDALLTSRTP
jgi:hypothetical protein